ncbi:hypothetical protein HYH02_005166 [Chlamydomonas schloesseri]|uniref:DMT family transporter n=1 Tax=Chlamydomonas schloesseri TaxID=2026947 RepID=A0A836B7D3_9CHLO|nr:hypothetical protein HYH02_005166 [Chlamydomonas schloesseri]|eukprot:KAG2449633.1 hypothetical protein HYH02_005166 [Chlamydomonas schloesseri]
MVSATYVVGCVCAGLAGAMLATQSGINSTLGAAVGKSFASVVSFAVGLGALLVFFAVDTAALGHKGPTLAAAAAVPWWAWVGGFLGAWYVAVVIIFAPVLGAATLMALFVCCQLATAVLLDSMGWVGFKQRPLHWARLVGLGLMLGGVVLVTYFDGGSTASKGAAVAQPPVPGLPPPSGPVVGGGRALAAAAVTSPLFETSDSPAFTAGGVAVALAAYSKDPASGVATPDIEAGATGKGRSGAGSGSSSGSTGDCKGAELSSDANV